MDKIIIAEQGNVPVLSESEKCPNRPHQSELIFSEFNQNLNNLYLYNAIFKSYRPSKYIHIAILPKSNMYYS